MLASPAAAQAFDCARQSTPIEHAICADPELSRLDTALNADFRDAKDATSGTTRRALLEQQRAWLRQRDKACPTGSTACLLPLYHDRVAALDALTARISTGNPALDSVMAAALLGSWLVAGYLVPGQPERQVSEQEKPPYLPVPGTTITGHPGALCDQNGACKSFGLDPKVLAAIPHGNRVAASLHLPLSAPFYLAFLGGKADYGLIPQPDGSLLAQFILCDARYTKCGYAFQRWTAQSPGAAIKVLAR